MFSTQFPPAATSYPLSFHKPAASCLSFSHSRPLFSITSSLFGQKPGGGYTLSALHAPGTFNPPTFKPTNSFASYHIPATPGISCNYALFRATAPSYPSYFQSVPHSFHRNRGVHPPSSTNAWPSSSLPFQNETFRASDTQKFRLFSDPKEVTPTHKAARYSKHLGRSTFFSLSSTSRRSARVRRPRCDPQHQRTCGRRVDEITGCFSPPAA